MALHPDFLRPLVISGPSGAGKSTLINRLMIDHNDLDKFGFPVPHTSRPPRINEEHGKDYYFISPNHFKALVNEGAFLEYDQLEDKFYGTSCVAVSDIIASGKRCLIDIDSQGVRQIKQSTHFNPVYLFIIPPSLDVLRERLRLRGRDSETSLQSRMETAVKEIEYAKTPGVYDIILVNDNFEKTYRALEAIAFGYSGPVDVLPPFRD